MPLACSDVLSCPESMYAYLENALIGRRGAQPFLLHSASRWVLDMLVAALVFAAAPMYIGVGGFVLTNLFLVIRE